MAYDRDGILKVSARDHQSGAEVTTTMTRVGAPSASAAERGDVAVRSLIVH
jgi:molecular chaperone DnaK (HSP70)